MMTSQIRRKRKRAPRIWQRFVFTSILTVLMLGLMVPTIPNPMNYYDADSVYNNPQLNDKQVLSSAGATGNNIDSVLVYSREIQGLDFSLTNSFIDTETHSTNLDFSQYHIPGWSLNEVLISTSKITGILEHEITQSSSSPSYSDFTIWEHSTGVYYDQLAQGFYNMGHDGQLQNVSLYYITPTYDPPNNNYAYIDIRSDYTDGSTNMVSSVKLNYVGFTPTWAHVTEPVVLNADTTYYTVINGTKLKDPSYPQIIWFYVDGAGTYPSRIHNTDGDFWGSRTIEALLNYTYIPWNTTSNAALEFQNPESVSLQWNSSALSGSEWLFSSTTNVSQVEFSSNQSISVEYDLTLRYKKDSTSTTSWYADSSGSNITWNITTTTDYPELSDSLDKNLTLSVPSDWTASHLFNITNPTQYYDHFTQVGSSVNCINLSDETWILECTSPNYLKTLSMFDASDDSIIADKASVSVLMDINSTIEDLSLNPVTNGNAHLSVLYQSSVEYSDDCSVTTGISHHQWNISSDSSSNGLHTIDLYWSNGTEVGYQSADVVVYYETNLGADQYIIDDYTYDSFYIGIDYNQTFPTAGIDSSSATVTYSFGAIVNQSLTDQGNGRWDANVFTDGMTPGIHTLTVYAVGYALENQSLTINVTLIHETLPLAITWSNTNNISYVETTELSVAYKRAGNIPVTNALVEVTIGTTTWQLDWDEGTQTYKITFNGTDIDPGFGSHILTIEASRVDFESQSNDTVTLDIHEEYTVFGVSWSGSTSITYIESVTLYVDYQMSNTTAIPSATVEVTIGTDVYFMNWNETSGRYWYQFNGDDTLPGFGIHYLNIEANKFGYQYQNDTAQILTIDSEPTTLVISWTNSNTISYVNSTTLIANFTQSDGSPVTSAIVNVTAGTGFWEMKWNPLTLVYELTFNGTDTVPGFGIHDVTVLAGKTGFVNRSNSTLNLTISIESTSIDISWSNTNSITFIENTTLVVSYWMSNSTPITGATINVTIGGNRWNLTWHDPSKTYRVTFNGSDVLPGFGTHDLSIRIGKYGYENHGPISETLIISKVPTNYEISWSNTNSITYIESTILSVNYTLIDGTPVIGATINVTIEGTPWNLDWDEVTETYQVELMGSDILLGLGNHSLIIRIGKFGYINYVITNETILITEEPTTLVLSWSTSNSITYVNSTTLIANFTQSNGDPVSGALVNVTAGTGFWLMKWNPLTFVYELSFNGTDVPPGFGTFEVIVLAGGMGYIDRSSSTTLIVDLETTSVTISWSNTNDITFLDQTTLIISYRMSNSSVIPVDAVVNVTIGGSLWNLTWDNDTKTYRVSFYGYNLTDLGTYNLLIQVGKYGYENYVNSTTKLTIREEPTSMSIGWLYSSTITYLESTILDVNYQIVRDMSPVTNATVIVIIETVPYQLLWDSGSQHYRYAFSGTDEIPGLGTFSLIINANKTGFESGFDEGETLIINEEPTNLTVQWANGINNPDFFSYTYLIVDYTYGGASPVIDAILNVSINSHNFRMEWNASGFYQLRINGSDTYLSVGTNSILVSAGKFGYAEKTDSDAEIIIPAVPTKLTLQWTSTDTITYVEYTTLQAYYVMYNDSLLYEASVNVTINGLTLPMIWSSSSNSYERIFYGSDSSLGLANFPILVEAALNDFQSLSNSSESLTIQSEPTALVISWIDGDNITYFGHTTLSVQYIMSNTTPISTGVLNATIGGVPFDLIWNSTSMAYEVVIYGDDARLDYLDYDVLINASAYGFIPSQDTYQFFTIRPEDTYLLYQWVPDNSISYLEVTILRIYYLYSSNHSSVLDAQVNATYVDTWIAIYNESSGAYEVTFTGSNILNTTSGPYVFEVKASKSNHLSILDSSQILTVIQEDTRIQAYWLDDDNTISYVESTTIFINYSIISSGVSIPDANLTVRIGTTTWDMVYNDLLGLYEFTFTGDMDPPGLGSFTLYISASYSFHDGFKDATNNTMNLFILSESVGIHSYWIGGDTITFMGSTILVVNYTMSNGSSIPLATVNVTIGTNYWIVPWHEPSETYRMIFNGSDSLPGLGYHELFIQASRDGFDPLPDWTLSLEIIVEPTTVTPRWSDPFQNDITYFEYTYLFVEYTMSDSSPILGASVNVTIGLDRWILTWNTTEQAYGIRFNGSDVSPGFGNHTLSISALQHGFAMAENQTYLKLDKDPTSIVVDWSYGNNISYIESTTLMVYYRMSNSSPILIANVEASIGNDTWILTWNSSAQAYCFTFNGWMNPPGIERFTIEITAIGEIFASQYTTTEFEIHKEPTSVTPSWTSETIDWTQSLILYVEYRDNYGSLIDEATQKEIRIDGIPYPLQGSDGNYWFEFNNTFDLGSHQIVVNISKYGYEYASIASITIDIVEAPTDLVLLWNAKTIDYLGQINLQANYSCYGSIVPQGGVEANITIDGDITLPLVIAGEFWIVNLTGVYLDLGSHSVIILAQAYGYVFAEVTDSIIVDEVVTNTLSVVWNPANITIEYTEVIQLVVEYTFYGGDVPDNATVDVTINSQVYALNYSAGAWRVEITGNQIGLGLFDATINAVLYGFTLQSNITAGLNVTAAANWFHVFWEPSSLLATYIDTVNLSVVYTEDYVAIQDATILVFINGTIYDLTDSFNSSDKMWHFSVAASDIDLGVWNVTVTANKTGYADGYQTYILIVDVALTTLEIQDTETTIYYDETTTIDIFYQLTNTSTVPGASISFTLDSIEQTITWTGTYWTATLSGTGLGVGVHTYTIIISAYGYKTQQNITVVTILSIPTSIISDTDLAVYARETVSFRFTYIDDRTSTSIDASEFNIIWNEFYSIVTLPNYTYVITIGGNDFHIGIYTFQLTLGKVGFDNSTGAINIEAIPIPVIIIFESSYSQYENETLHMELQLIDTVHSSSINWGYVMVELEGVGYLAIYSSTTSSYIVNFRLPLNIDPGVYTLSIYSTTEDCVETTVLSSLEVLSKSTYILTIDTLDQIEAGSSLTISITAMEGSDYVSGITIDVSIVVTLSEGGHQFIVEERMTDSNGLVTIIFEVPTNAIELEITSSFDGSISEWPAVSPTKSVEVTPVGTGSTGLTMPDPLVLTIVTGGISIPLIGLALRRRRRSVIEVSSPVSITPTPPILPSIEATGIQKQLIDEILNNEEGITRADLSRRFGISSSKVGSMVNDLLDSDIGFYEVKIGAKKLIKFKRPD